MMSFSKIFSCSKRRIKLFGKTLPWIIPRHIIKTQIVCKNQNDIRPACFCRKKSGEKGRKEEHRCHFSLFGFVESALREISNIAVYEWANSHSHNTKHCLGRSSNAGMSHLLTGNQVVREDYAQPAENNKKTILWPKWFTIRSKRKFIKKEYIYSSLWICKQNNQKS